MPHVTLEHHTLYFEDVGSGEPMVLLHGFPLSSQSFWPQLERPPAGVRLLLPDHRGFGRSTGTRGPLTMEQIASDVLALLDATGLPSAVLGGVSMGGYAALALTRMAPQRVRGLVLIDTQHLADDAAGRERRERVAQEAERDGAGLIAQAMGPRLLAAQASPELRERLHRLMSAQAPEAIAAASRGMALRRDASEVLASYPGPTLMVVGAEDPITPPATARAMAALARDATLEVIEGAGHLPNLEQPELFGAVLEAFCARLQATMMTQPVGGSHRP